MAASDPEPLNIYLIGIEVEHRLEGDEDRDCEHLVAAHGVEQAVALWVERVASYDRDTITAMAADGVAPRVFQIMQPTEPGVMGWYSHDVPQLHNVPALNSLATRAVLADLDAPKPTE